MDASANLEALPRVRYGFLASQTAYVGLALVLLSLAITWLAPAFMSIGNLINISKNFSYVAIVSLGATLVIITAGIDLSVGSVMALVAIVTALLLSWLSALPVAKVPGLPTLLSVAGGLSAAALIGLLNGYFIAVVGLTPFVTTLGMLSICRGLAYVITQGHGLAIAGPDSRLFYALTDGSIHRLPVPLLYLLCLGGVTALLLRHTRTGRYIYAVGGNEASALLAGVPVTRMKIQVYLISALLAGFAGILMAGWLGSVPSNLATGYELRIIAAAVIGGANLAGGVGGAGGAIIGSALIEVIRNGLVLARVNAYWQDTLVGVIIILAVLLDRLRSRRLGR
ncbi:MAG: ABC transporter permease [Acetobacteraceae bacterium]|nr:ABC transporter permease [Acetobacteraceae bacterium]